MMSLKIVICCGMRRGGSTLQSQLVAAIIPDAQLLTASIDGVQDLFHRSDDNIQVVKVHEYVPGLEKNIHDGRVKVIYVYRDVRDVLVSMSNKSDESITKRKCMGLIQNVVNEYNQWTSLNQIYTTSYEEMVLDLEKEVRKLSDFLDVRLSANDITRIAREYSLSKNKERIVKFDYSKNGVGMGSNKYNPQNLLHHNHINSGKIGQWKSYLSEDVIACIEWKAEKYLVANGYNFSSTRSARVKSHINYRIGEISAYFISILKKVF